MAPDDAYPAEMPIHPSSPTVPLDDDTVERLLDGRLAADDTPPAYAEVARLLRAAAGPARPDELAGQAAAQAAFRAARHRPARVRARLIAVTVAGTLLAGGAAVAAGVPVPVDRVVRTIRGPTGAPAPGGTGHVRSRPPARPTSPTIRDGRPPVTPSTRDQLDERGGSVAAGDGRPIRGIERGKPGRPGKPPKHKPPKQGKPK
jgi:hypothetical protein